MDAATTERLLYLKLKRSEILDKIKIEMKNGCDCEELADQAKKLSEEISYIEFNGVEYIQEYTKAQIETLHEEQVIDPTVSKSDDYFLEDFVEVIECTGDTPFTITLTSVVGQKGRELIVINGSTATVTLSAATGEEIGNTFDAAQTLQLATGESVMIKSNGITTWRIL